MKKMMVKKMMMTKMMVKIILCLSLMIVLAACGNTTENETLNQEQSTEVEAAETTAAKAKEATYMQITPQEAKELMDIEEGYVILDVRSQSEYDEMHIPGAIVIPDTDIEEKAEEILTDRSQLILVYCRSGRRSKNASAALAKLGYTNVKEFGGINDWPYEVE